MIYNYAPRAYVYVIQQPSALNLLLLATDIQPYVKVNWKYDVTICLNQAPKQQSIPLQVSSLTIYSAHLSINF